MLVVIVTLSISCSWQGLSPVGKPWDLVVKTTCLEQKGSGCELLDLPCTHPGSQPPVLLLMVLGQFWVPEV